MSTRDSRHDHWYGGVKVEEQQAEGWGYGVAARTIKMLDGSRT